MPIVTYTVVCTKKQQLTKDVWEFAFKKPEGFTFKAGQFILFDVPLVEDEKNIQTRAYSMASAPHEPELLFVMKMIPTGRASRWFLEKIDVGSTIPMKGPFGLFTIDPVGTKNLLLIGTGTGIAPFRGQVLDLVQKKDPRRIDIVFGVRHEDDFFWHQEFDPMAKADTNIRLHYTLTQPPEGWSKFVGRVHTIVPQLELDMSQTVLFACGNPLMTKSMKEIAMSEWGLSKAEVHVEGYI